jgi:hypothetical protein
MAAVAASQGFGSANSIARPILFVFVFVVLFFLLSPKRRRVAHRDLATSNQQRMGMWKQERASLQKVIIMPIICHDWTQTSRQLLLRYMVRGERYGVQYCNLMTAPQQVFTF